MCWRLLLGVCLAASTQAFSIAPLQPATKNSFVALKRHPTTDVNAAQQLFLTDQLGDSHSIIPYFSARPDHSIIWDAMGWCIEADGTRHGDVVRMNTCNGGQSQMWTWLPSGRGTDYHIQLKGSNQCLALSGEGDLKDGSLGLWECEDTESQVWKFEERISIPTGAPLEQLAFSSFRRHAAASFAMMVLVAILYITAGLRQEQDITCRVVTNQRGMSASADQGGITAVAPWTPLNVAMAQRELSPSTIARRQHDALAVDVSPERKSDPTGGFTFRESSEERAGATLKTAEPPAGLMVRDVEPAEKTDVARLRRKVFSAHLTSPYSIYMQDQLFRDALEDKSATLVAVVTGALVEELKEARGTCEATGRNLPGERPDESTVVGSADVKFVPFGEQRLACYVNNVCVDPCMRRKGIARTIMAGLEARARWIPIDVLVLHVRRSNEAAFRLYASLGFDPNYDATIRESFSVYPFMDPEEDPPEMLMCKWL